MRKPLPSDPHLPGFSAPSDLLHQEEFERRRRAIIEAVDPHGTSRCWGCNRKKSGFICENEDLRTLRKRCIRCLALDQREQREIDKQAAATAYRLAYVQDLKSQMRRVRALPKSKRAKILRPLREARIRSVKIRQGCPLWNQIAGRLACA